MKSSLDMVTANLQPAKVIKRSHFDITFVSQMCTETTERSNNFGLKVCTVILFVVVVVVVG